MFSGTRWNTISLVCLAASLTLAAQPRRPSAWETLVRKTPAVVEDESVTWRERLALHALTPEQAEAYWAGRADDKYLRLEDGRTLAEYLEARLSPPAQVFVPLAAPCPLFSVTAEGGFSESMSLSAGRGDLGSQGGTAEGCGIAEEASAVLLRTTVQSLAGVPARLKLWAASGPEPAYGDGHEEVLDWPLAYGTTRLAPLCGGCPEGGIELRTDQAAHVSARALGYFRPIAARDAPGGGIRLSTEGSSNNFFGTGAGAGISTGGNNSFFGAYAGNSNDTGNRNSFFGGGAGELNTGGDDNSFFGYGSGILNTTGEQNAFFGTFAGGLNTTTSRNSFFGYKAGFSNTGGGNSFFGHEAGFSNTSAGGNSFFGDSAGYSNTGFENSFFGASAGSDNTVGQVNSFFGQVAGASNTTGSYNSFFGSAAGVDNTEGQLNTFFGVSAGSSNTVEDNNSTFGAVANIDPGPDPAGSPVTNATAIGYRALVSQSNSLVLGSVKGLNAATADVKVGIGTDTPQYALHVKRTDGTAKIVAEEASTTTASRSLFELQNNGAAFFNLRNTNLNRVWSFSVSGIGAFQIDDPAVAGGAEMTLVSSGTVRIGPGGTQNFLLDPSGNLTIKGDLTANGMHYPSDRNLKENIVQLDGGEVLERLSRLPIASWNYRTDPARRHVGPMAQDFREAFGVGSDGRSINAMDEAGVTLAAVKGLNEKVRRQAKELERQRQENRSLRERVEALERLLGRELVGRP